ncbi:hypothetical protein Dimus_002491 [Dionaea muscipula]
MRMRLSFTKLFSRLFAKKEMRILMVHKYFEDAFQIFERGVKIFKHRHVTCQGYGTIKLERARELFERVVESVSESISVITNYNRTEVDCINSYPDMAILH